SGCAMNGSMYQRKMRIMPKPSITYRCETCGAEAPRWMGRCPDCGAWNTMTGAARVSRPHSGRAAADARPRAHTAALLNINEVEGDREERHATGLGELDRVRGRRVCSRFGGAGWRGSRNRQI
ncbi:DNA repair protein RadA, partial [mine drainage metagenome]